MKSDNELLDWLDGKARSGETISLHGGELLVGTRYIGNPFGFEPGTKPTFRKLIEHAIEAESHAAATRS